MSEITLHHVTKASRALSEAGAGPHCPISTCRSSSFGYCTSSAAQLPGIPPLIIAAEPVLLRGQPGSGGTAVGSRRQWWVRLAGQAATEPLLVPAWRQEAWGTGALALLLGDDGASVHAASATAASPTMGEQAPGGAHA